MCVIRRRCMHDGAPHERLQARIVEVPWRLGLRALQVMMLGKRGGPHFSVMPGVAVVGRSMTAPPFPGTAALAASRPPRLIRQQLPWRAAGTAWTDSRRLPPMPLLMAGRTRGQRGEWHRCTRVEVNCLDEMDFARRPTSKFGKAGCLRPCSL